MTDASPPAAPSPSTEDWSSPEFLGRAFSDALHTGLLRLATDRTAPARRPERPTPHGRLLWQHRAAIRRRLGARLRNLLTPPGGGTPVEETHARLLIWCERVLAHAAGAPAPPLPAGRVSYREAAMASTVLTECVLLHLPTEDDGSTAAGEAAAVVESLCRAIEHQYDSP